MTDYRRYFVPGGTFFFTVVTRNRVPLFQEPLARQILGSVLRECQEKWPFEINAMVLLSEHLPAIRLLPSGDAAYPHLSPDRVRSGLVNPLRAATGIAVGVTLWRNEPCCMSSGQ